MNAINPDLLFVQNQVNRPAFTPEELDRAIKLQTVEKVATAAAEIAIANRPGLSPAELVMMQKAKILPVGNPLRSGIEFEHNGERLRLARGRRRKRRSSNG